MHKLLLLASLLLLTIGIFAFTILDFRDAHTPPIEMVAFSSLTDEKQDLIPTSPKDSTVELISVSDTDSSLFNKPYANDQVYAVTFNNTVTDNSGNLVVYIALDESTVIGKGFTSK